MGSRRRTVFVLAAFAAALVLASCKGEPARQGQVAGPRAAAAGQPEAVIVGFVGQAAEAAGSGDEQGQAEAAPAPPAEAIAGPDGRQAQAAARSREASPRPAVDEAEASMGRREGSRFLVKFEGGENAVAGHLIGLLLEEAYYKVGGSLGLYPDGQIEALLYSKDRFRDVTRSPAWAGAVYDGRIKLPAGGITEKTSELEKVIFHEYTHALVRAASKGAAPMWLNEGIAQYEEGRSAEGQERALAAVASAGRLSLGPLEGSFMGLDEQEAGYAYLASLSATEYLIREFGIFSVRNILEGLGQGMPLEEAIYLALGLSYSEFEEAWGGYLRRGR